MNLWKSYWSGRGPVFRTAQIATWVLAGMAAVNTLCLHNDLDGWTTLKAVFILGPALAGLCWLLWIAQTKPVWVINKDRRP